MEFNGQFQGPCNIFEIRSLKAQGSEPGTAAISFPLRSLCFNIFQNKSMKNEPNDTSMALIIRCI